MGLALHVWRGLPFPPVLVPQGQAGPLQALHTRVSTAPLGGAPEGQTLREWSLAGVTGAGEKATGRCGEDRKAGREAAWLRVEGQHTVVGDGEGPGFALCAELSAPSCKALGGQRMGRVGIPSLLCVGAGALSGRASAPAAEPAFPFLSLPAGRQGPGHPAQPPAEVAPSPALSTASGLMGLVARRLWRRPSVQACPGNPLPPRPATCSAVQPGTRGPGER